MSKIYSSLKCFVVMFFLSCSFSSIGQSLACSGGVNISMDQNCEVVLHSGLVLKGPDRDLHPSGFLLSVKNPDGSIPTDVLVYDAANDVFSDTVGSQGEYLKFLHPGKYVVTVVRKSDGTRCWGDLLIEDKLPPFTEGTCPCAADDPTPDPSCLFSCASVNLLKDSDVITGNAGLNPSFIDNCGNVVSVTFHDELTQDVTCGDWIITRTWRSLVPDANGVMALKDLDCVQKFYFQNIGVNAITPPSKKVVVTCGIDTDPESLRNYFSSTDYFNNPNLDTALVRSYPTLTDTVLGHGVIFRKIGEGLSGDTNDGLCKITASYTDTPTIPHCGDIGYKFVRTWHIIDWCTNETLPPVTQIIKVMDNEAPSFTIKDTIAVTSTTPWTCVGDIMVPAPDTIFDNCASSSQLSWIAYINVGATRIEANASNGYNLDGIGTGTYDVTYVVSDICNNDREDTAVLVIKDLVKPVALSKRRIKITFTSFQGECVAKVTPSNIDAGSFDACDDELDFSIRRNGTNDPFGPFVKFNGDDLTDVTATGTPFGEVDIEMLIVDDSGNSSLAWTTVVLEDKFTDVTTVCGQTTYNLGCDAVLDSVIVQYQPTVTLNGCADKDLPVDYTVRSNGRTSTCNTGTVIVDYFIEGSVGIICTKTFNFGDLDPLGILWPAAEITVSCTETNFGDVTITGGMCNNAFPTENLREFDFSNGSGYCKKILREITVIDWCNYEPNTGDSTGVYRFTQTIKVQDNSNPVITCTDVTVSAGADCDIAGVVVTATGVDEGVCSEGLTWHAAVDGDNDGVYEIELTVASTGDSTVAATINSLLSVGQYDVRWRASDACGNSDEVFCKITITDDKAPSPQCITAVSTATMNTDGSVVIWAADFDPMSNSTDNCGGPVTYSFSGDSRTVPSMTFTCSDIADGVSAVLELEVYVWDQSGNTDFCIVNLRIDDNSDSCPDPMMSDTTVMDTMTMDTGMTASAVISGMIMTSLGDRLESAMVSNMSMTHQIALEQMTDIDGQFAFANNAMMDDYEISATKSDDYLNGVSTLDLILIQRHILGYTKFDNAYHTIAADISGDNRISALDLVLLRNVILGRTDELPGGDSWRFVNATQQFSDPTSPWPLEQKLLVSELGVAQANQDFIAVKLGDVNGNAIANSTLLGANRSDKIRTIEVVDRKVRAGEQVEVSLNVNDLKTIYGLQLQLRLNNASWSDASSTGFKLEDAHINMSDEDMMISWTSIEGVNEGTVMVSFEAGQEGWLSEMLSIDDQGFSSEVYEGESLESASLEISFTNELADSFVLYQNVPNPFNGETSISFSLSKAGDVEISIFDVTGRQLFSQTANYDAGLHSLDIDQSIVDQKGVLYYQLSFNNEVATKKMISIE